MADLSSAEKRLIAEALDEFAVMLVNEWNTMTSDRQRALRAQVLDKAEAARTLARRIQGLNP